MTCQELVDFLRAYVDGELPESEQAAFEDHLGECPPCVAYLDSYRETIRLGRAVCANPDDPIPDDVPERLIEGILAARRGR